MTRPVSPAIAEYAEMEKLREVNAELLKALELIAESTITSMHAEYCIGIARAAIARAKSI